MSQSATSLFLPLPESAQRMLADLLGKPVTVKKATPMILGPTAPGMAATYVYDSGELGALALCDLPVSCHIGAALMLLPPSVSAEGVKSGRLTETIIDNVREVLNIAASLFIHDQRPHVRLKTIHPLPSKLPDNVARTVLRPAARLDLEVTVQGYGGGKLSLLTV